MMYRSVSAPLHHAQSPSFPTRRSSDLQGVAIARGAAHDLELRGVGGAHNGNREPISRAQRREARAMTGSQRQAGGDRKSTRLNSSHVKSSYAVFCLKKKK